MNFFRKLRLKKPDAKGYTLIELMIVTAVVGIITPAVTYLFVRMSQGMAADEMHTELSQLNANTMLRIRDRLLSNKHFFQQGNPFQALVQFSGAPAVLTGSQPATIQVTDSFSNASVVKADFGNQIFFAAGDSPTTIGTQAYYAPLTVKTNASIAVTYSSGQPATVTLDVYRFYYYYLTATNANALRNCASYRLVEWRSIQYADFYELSSITDSTLLRQVVSWVATAGSVTTGSPAITNAWDPTQTATASAFYTLTSGGTTAAVGTPTIAQADWSYMTHISSGILCNGFKYGISCNNPPFNNVPSVPLYGPTTMSLGGFEVGFAGNTSGRQVFIRSLLLAQGAAPQVIYNDMTSVDTIRDVW
jgi:prepilin-type N-terminal cleavage/methylation domain-containing protein